MGFYDLYGRGYKTRRDAEIAEDTQCALIDAEISSRNIQDIQQQSTYDLIYNESKLRNNKIFEENSSPYAKNEKIINSC